MFRVHQFDKVEMFVFTTMDVAGDEHERLLAIEEELIGALGIPYRVVNVAAGDLGASAVKKYDIEGWFPGQERYRELTSTSNTTDFQARRLDIRTRRDGKPEHVATLNGTAVTARTVIALLENFQDEGGCGRGAGDALGVRRAARARRGASAGLGRLAQAARSLASSRSASTGQAATARRAWASSDRGTGAASMIG